MTRYPRSLGNASLLALLTSALASCGDSATVLQSLDSGGGDATVATDGDLRPDLGADSHTLGDAPMDSFAHADAPHADASEDTSPADSGCPPGDMPVGDGGCEPLTIRRPFLVGSSMRSADAVARPDWSRQIAPVTRELDVATASLLAESWLRDGLEEHASVAAFARFTMHLLSVGAPPDLVARSQRASLDEIEHARSCFALAERYGKRTRGPSSLIVHDAMSPTSLAEIAALTAEEGCVGETLGAVLAAEQLAVATDPETWKILRRIASDEARHAELAWRFTKWAAVKGGSEVKRAIKRATERAIESTLAMEIRSYDGIDVDVWHSHGRLTCSEAKAVAARAVREVVVPCLAAVMGDGGGAASARRSRNTDSSASVGT
jgi:hypothetical protein